MKCKLFLFGGFLGSGKTTLLVELGKRFTAQGFKVAIVTNDQGDFLVDTAYAESAGFAAGEVVEGCFCCNFGSFIDNLEEIMSRVAPDIILAEPVGSCTDLSATVVNPFREYHRELADLCGFYVLADIPRLNGEYRELNLSAPVTPREVLISHQLREASILLLSKADTSAAEERARAAEYLTEINPEAELRELSSITGQGLEELVDEMRVAPPLPARNSLELDYELYAEAEAEMGWYNGSFELTSKSSFLPADVAADIIMELKRRFGRSLVHGKVLISTPYGSLKLSLVAGSMHSDAALDPGREVDAAGGIVNLRGAAPPEELSAAVREILESLETERRLEVSGYREKALIPAPPQPTHRL